MLITRVRSLTAIAAGALMLTALAGCGSDDKAEDADAKTTPSATSSPSESSSAGTDPSGDIDLSGAAAPGERLTKENLVPTLLAAMREKQTAHMEMEIGSSLSADADMRYSEDGTDMKMSMDMGPNQAVVLLVDGVMYMQQAAGGKYIKIDKDTPGMGDLVNQMSGFGPESSVSSMQGSLQKVEYVGTGTVDGDKVSRYKVTADTSGLAKTLGTTAGSADLPKTVTYDIYVDGENLMRRIDMSVAGQEVDMVVSDWGKPVDIKAPPASQVQAQ